MANDSRKKLSIISKELFVSACMTQTFAHLSPLPLLAVVS